METRLRSEANCTAAVRAIGQLEHRPAIADAKRFEIVSELLAEGWVKATRKWKRDSDLKPIARPRSGRSDNLSTGLPSRTQNDSRSSASCWLKAGSKQPVNGNETQI